MEDVARPARLAAGALALLLATCATPATPAAQPLSAEPPPAARTKVLTIGISTPPETFSILSASAPAGGWTQITELHSDGLVTSEFASRRPIGRLAEKVPTVEDGTVSFLADGRMRVLFRLRKGVTWHDGAPFTAHDLVLSYKLGGPEGIPTAFNEPVRRMESVEAPDDSTLVITYKAPYYLATLLGPHAFWPLPRHILSEPYERYLRTRSFEEILHLPYWTTEYVHLGPFRLTSFDPGNRLSFEAYNAYFLGRPKIDVVHLLVITDQNTLLSNLMAGSLQIAPANALVAEAGTESKRRWDASGEGTVHLKESSLRLLVPQLQPSIQVEPTVLDPRVRRAFLHALDREELAEVLSGGRDRAAWSLLSADDVLYPAVKDALRPFAYDPARARAILAEVGWTVATDGSLRHSSDGRRFHTSVWGTPGREQEMTLYPSYWRALGIDVEEWMVPAARYRDRQSRTQFPGWEFTGTNLTKMMTDPAAGPHNNWTGNANGYEDPRARRLVDALETTIVERERLEAMKAINDYLVAHLPALPIFYLVQYTAAHRSVKAFDDMAGADGSERIYGGYARNAYLWDLQ